MTPENRKTIREFCDNIKFYAPKMTAANFARCGFDKDGDTKSPNLAYILIEEYTQKNKIAKIKQPMFKNLLDILHEPAETQKWHTNIMNRYPTLED